MDVVFIVVSSVAMDAGAGATTRRSPSVTASVNYIKMASIICIPTTGVCNCGPK